MPDLFEAADRAVAGSDELQQFVRGERTAAVPPGALAFVASNLLLLMCWLGVSIAVGAYASREVRPLVTMAIAVGMVPVLCFVPYRVVLGLRSAHRAMAYLTNVLVAACVLAIVATGLRVGFGRVEAFFWCSLVAGVVANRLVRSPGYALCAAFFRAKRAYRIDAEQRRRNVLEHRSV
jgi:hypothetical protein